MKVVFSKIAREELKDYKKHLLELKKKGKLPSYVEIPKSFNELHELIKTDLKEEQNHNDSIYPKDCEFGKNYKIGIEKLKHYISFYKIVKDDKGNPQISIERCLHSTKLKKELDRKGIKPKEDADPYVLLDLLKIERGDEVAKLEDGKDSLPEELQKEFDEREKELESRIESQNKKEGKKKEKEKPEDKGKEEEVYDKETGKKVKRIVYTGPKGGRFYKSDNGEKVYIDEKRTFKSLSSLLLESKIVSLNQYIKKERCCNTSRLKELI